MKYHACSKKIFWHIFIFFSLMFLMPNMLYANTYYVAKNGADSNSGIETGPFQTIKKGVSALSAGDTLYVKAGTYRESILSWQTPIPNGESWNKPITIAAFPGDAVTIIPPDGQAFFWVKEAKAKYLVIDGFIIDGINRAWHGFKFHGGTTHIRVQNSEIKNSQKSGILVTGPDAFNGAPPNTYHEFINLKVHDNGSQQSLPGHGFYIETSRNLVEGSEFYNNAGNGGKFFHGNQSEVANNNIARNNTFHDNSTSGKWSCGLILSSGKDNMAYNNVAYGNFAGFCIQARVSNSRLYNNISYNNDIYGIYVGISTTSGSRVENNTLFENGTYGIFVGDDAKNTVVKNNIAYLSKGNNIGLRNQTGTITSNNLTSDPLFMNPKAKDFHLKTGSPAIDAGATINFISDDFEGNERPQGSSHDIGAYEINSGGDTSPPTRPRDVVIN